MGDLIQFPGKELREISNDDLSEKLSGYTREVVAIEERVETELARLEKLFELSENLRLEMQRRGLFSN